MPFALPSSPSNSEISEAVNYLLANFGANLAADPNTGEITGPSGIVIAYLYKYLAIKYADSFDGSSGFSDSPTNKQYYGVNNSNSNVESTNPADYIWYKVAGSGFGTTNFLFYQVSGGRQINFFIGTAAPSTYYLQADTSAIDLDILTVPAGYQNALPTIYIWTADSTAPARPSTTSTYDWPTGAYSAPSGWSTTIPINTTSGAYLWGISIPLTVEVTVTTSVLDWTDVAYPIYVIGSNGSTGDDGPRSSTGYIYYQTAAATAPSSPSASGYNFDTGSFSSLTSGWSTTFTAPAPVTNPSTEAGSKFWAVRYNVSEATYGGTQTVTLTAVFNWQNLDGLVTFTNVSAPSGTTFIDGGNIITNSITTGKLVAGDLTAFNIQTAASGSRWQINGGTYAMQIRGFYSTESSPRMILDSADGTVNFTGRSSASINVFSSPTTLYTVSLQNTGGGNAVWARSQSGGNSVLGDASTSTGHGGHFKGNATRAPLFLEPQASLPSNRAYGSVCFYNGWLCFANGTHWYQSDGTQLT